MENLTLILNISQICRLQLRHFLPVTPASSQLGDIDKIPEVAIGIRLPPLNIFLHGEQIAFLTELGLILGDFGLAVAKAAAEVSNDKPPPKKAIENSRNRSNTSERLLDPTRPQSKVSFPSSSFCKRTPL